jgi:hypothetical protein
MRSNCVYISHYAIGLGYKPYPEICLFGLNRKEAAVGFSIKITWETPETPFWFNSSFANAQEWNLMPGDS